MEPGYATIVGVQVFVCRKCDGGPRLAERLRRDAALDVCAVGCQKICSHHVVGVRIRGTTTWFERIDRKPKRSALRTYLRAAGDGRMSKELRRALVPKRAGQLRS